MRCTIIAVAALLAACSQQTPVAEEDTASTQEQTAPAIPPNDGGKPFDVASDSRARYTLLGVTASENGDIIATTKRDGPSGVSYARREIDCAAQTFRYVGEGDTLDQANQPAPNIGEMAPLVDGSISDVTVKVACANQ